MLRMLQRVIGEGIQIVWQPGSDVWPVNVDPAQIDRVLTNLTVNARDAIGEAGRITITTRNVTVGPDFPRADGAPGDYACLTVSDTGCGMEPEVLRHLFEPFFTTKEKGRGTGLGLSTVYGIVRQNGGFLDVASEPGAGTVLALYLPRAFAATGGAEAPALEATPARGAETVLLVEDEEQVLMLMRNVLARQGYTVLPASRPVDALALAERHDGPIHLILTDVVMPGMNGRELADRVAARRPGIRRLYVSGYTADVLAPQGVLDGSVQFLQKPFSLPDFVRKVREVLDAS
jgi:CheY-like chemotaxis protein